MKYRIRAGSTLVSIIACCSIVVFCSRSDGQQRTIITSKKWEFIEDIPTPKGYHRIHYDSTSFSGWVRHLPLAENKTIRMYSGETVNRSFYNVLGVVQLPMLFDDDLEQCADYAMRIWAEYHKQNNLLDKLYLFNYSGNKKYYNRSGKTYTSFLRWAFAYSNSYSLKKGCKEITESEIVPGDMVVQNENGGIGHVSVILDVSKNEKEQTLYLIGFSFMPAQEFHVEGARDGYGKEGWFSLKGFYRYLADHLDLGKPVLRRFVAEKCSR